MAITHPRPSARETILDAAETLVHELGAGNLTLDAVAQRAAVSKGGLLYHFPSKEALLQGMVARQLEQFEKDQEAHRDGPPGDAHAGLVAFMRATFEDSAESRRLCAAMLAAVANKPELLEPARAFHNRQVRQFSGGSLGFERAAILWLATAGLWFMELLQVSPFSDAERKRLTRRILEMADQGF
ncbi:MAG: TetR/AcrR family transcriptional regulator [Verrucomicrobiales bacterium]|nr:TetR/AcrR family transcriptional regulator [Verrucomicrobiales bacterium]MCP5528279.1 TetR/AcrR family transcriptional regulator [Verrucomicrobiales bacterium]